MGGYSKQEPVTFSIRLLHANGYKRVSAELKMHYFPHSDCYGRSYVSGRHSTNEQDPRRIRPTRSGSVNQGRRERVVYELSTTKHVDDTLKDRPTNECFVPKFDRMT